ncbi:MAG TPA: DUF5615 family PIN-like protein [Chloroflexia bacterium]|nr:DUF5615 family PIN-like protein [Chloroflexia bacterium]
MKFKIDENLPVDIAELLRAASHDAVTVIEQGRPDKEPATASGNKEEGLRN